MATSFDFAWKRVLGWWMTRDDITFDTEKEVGQLPLTIDAVARCGATACEASQTQWQVGAEAEVGVNFIPCGGEP
jgi:hypothetical protein